MRPDTLTQLQRWRVAQETGHLPPDLAAWVDDVLACALAPRRRELRARFLRAAFERLPQDTVYARAEMIKQLAHVPREVPAPPGTPLALVREAIRLDGLPSWRHLLRMFEADDLG